MKIEVKNVKEEWLMVRVVILTGSPHYNGASQKLVDNFEKGIKEAGNQVYRYDAGQQGESQPHFLQLEHVPGMEVGITDNDLVEKEVMPKLLDADIVVLVSSLYYFMHKLSDYMRWQMIDEIYADDSWNDQKLAKFAQKAYKLGKSIK